MSSDPLEDAPGGALTARRRWIYTADVKGRFQRLHRIVGLVQHVLLFTVPWIPIGGHPALMLDLPARRLYVLGATFTPADTELLVVIGLIAAVSLFFISSLMGRLWCGYLCPQTVFLEELIRPIERWFEGSRGKRRKADQGPLTARRAFIKGSKWGSYVLIAGVLAMTMMSYFTPAWDLWTFRSPTWAYGLAGVLGLTLAIDFIWFREQFCNYLCPYARFQGALTDANSLVVQYDADRGEPRTKRKLQVQLGLNPGSCIECNQCVSVCPQGIDIRDGFQLECIQCARCVDACEGVMLKLGEKPLVQFAPGETSADGRVRWLRPRTAMYATALAALVVTFTVLVATRHELQASVNRLPGSLYTLDADGSVRNTFMLQLTNNHGQGETAVVAVRVEGLDNSEVIVPEIAVASGQTMTVPLVVRVPVDAGVRRTTPIEVVLTTDFDEIEVSATFKSGSKEEI